MSHRVRIFDAVVNRCAYMSLFAHAFQTLRAPQHRARIRSGARNGTLNFNALVFGSATKTHKHRFHSITRTMTTGWVCVFRSDPTRFEFKIRHAKIGTQPNITWNSLFSPTHSNVDNFFRSPSESNIIIEFGNKRKRRRFYHTLRLNHYLSFQESLERFLRFFFVLFLIWIEYSSEWSHSARTRSVVTSTPPPKQYTHKRTAGIYLLDSFGYLWLFKINEKKRVECVCALWNSIKTTNFGSYQRTRHRSIFPSNIFIVLCHMNSLL